LISIVVVPCRSISPTSDAALAASCSSVAARVDSTVRLIPPAAYRRPGHPSLELVSPVTGEHQMRMRVDEAGHHRATADVDRGVGCGAAAAGPAHTTCSPWRTRAAPVTTPSGDRSPSDGSAVTSWPIPVTATAGACARSGLAASLS
jgi:hypothetical protein